MDIRFQTGGPTTWKGAVMLVFACKGEDPAKVCTQIEEVAPWFTIAPGRKDFDGAKLQTALFHGHPDQDVPRVLVVGLGARKAFSLAVFRQAVATALGRCRDLGLTSVLLPVPSLESLPADVMRLLEEASLASVLGLYNFTSLRKPNADAKPDPEWLAFAFNDAFVPDAAQEAIRLGEHAALGMYLTRNLANMPPNLLPPMALADAAATMAKEHGMHFTLLGEQALKELGCNALLAVGQGSEQETCMAIVEHAPKGHEEEEPLVFIGKGLTFDSGGISLKPAQNMHLMKCDMSGAAAVVGALHAAGLHGVQRRIIGILVCAENMPGGKAMRPGDVVTSHAGKTVEIINTDAEGRLALCDGLSYAQKTWSTACIVDIATLTGACSVALGTELAGLFTDDITLREYICSLGAVVGDGFWPLPLWAPYAELLRSDVADISHMGPREGGAINAALFLKEFVRQGVRWVHMDIAGVDWASKKTPTTPVGSVGFGVRTLFELMRGGV